MKQAVNGKLNNGCNTSVFETVKKGTDREEKEHSGPPPLVRGGVEQSETEG